MTRSLKLLCTVLLGFGLLVSAPAGASALPVPDIPVPDIPGLPCNPLIFPLGCADDVVDNVGDVADEVIGGISSEIAELAGGVFTSIVAFFGQMALSVLEVTTTWWIDNPNLLESRGGIVESISQLFFQLGTVMVLAGFVWQGIQVMFQRRAEPLIDLARATFTYMFVAAAGIGLVQAAAAATDALASDLVSSAFDLEGLPEVFGELLISNPGLFLGFSLVIAVAGVIQALLLILREISLIILTGLLIFAASGQYFKFSRSWLGNLLGMIIPILLWKPVAAVLIAIALEWISSAEGPGDLIIGLVLFVLAAVAYQPLQRVFQVFTPGGGASSSSGGGIISAVGTGAVGAALISSSGSSGAAAGGAAAGPAGVAAAGAVTATQQGSQAAGAAIDPSQN